MRQAWDAARAWSAEPGGWAGRRVAQPAADKLAALVGRAAFERLFGDIDAARVGRPRYGAVVLPKRPLLQP
jgi:hypothetical protein